MVTIPRIPRLGTNPVNHARLLLARDHTLGTLAERLAGVRGGARLVVEADAGLQLTVAQAAETVDRWAGGVAAASEPGDVVVVATPNGYEQALLCLAASRAGRLPAPVNDKMRSEEIDHVVADSGAGLVIRSVEELPAAGPFGPAVPAYPGDVAALFYTSGTTGRPKGVELTHTSLLGAAAYGAAWPAALRRDEAVVSLPVAHIMGFITVIGLACAGIPVFFLPRFNPVRVLDAIESRRATLFVGVPAMYRMMASAGAASRDLSSVRLWISGADAMPTELAQEFKSMGATATLPGVGPMGEAVFAEGYGMVETGGGVAAKVSPPLLGFGLGSGVGMALPGYTFRVVGADGTEVGTGQSGELWVRGPGVLAGYHGDPDATSDVRTDDGWLRTGDAVRRGPLGTVVFEGRQKDVIKHGGYSVYAVEVEQALEGHPDVAEAAVVGTEDPERGEVPAAALLLHPGSTFDEAAMVTWATERLSDYKVPKRWLAVEDLPHTGTDKIQRSEVRTWFEEP